MNQTAMMRNVTVCDESDPSNKYDETMIAAAATSEMMMRDSDAFLEFTGLLLFRDS